MAWLPPAYKGNSGRNSVGYDPYDLFDLGEFDQKGGISTKYGNKKQYTEAVEALRKVNIGTIVDIVLNHKAGGDEKEKFNVYKVDPNNRLNFLSEPFEIESYTKFTFPVRNKKYSDFIWDFTCFSGVDYAEGQEGNFIYQIINKIFPETEILYSYFDSFTQQSVKFGLASIVIATPAYFAISFLITKYLFEGKILENSKVRKWWTFWRL